MGGAQLLLERRAPGQVLLPHVDQVEQGLLRQELARRQEAALVRRERHRPDGGLPLELFLDPSEQVAQGLQLAPLPRL